jgi:hypothetical protein
MDRNKTIEIVARIGIFGTFLGHGVSALFVNNNWIPLLTCYGFSIGHAKQLMPFIGMLDIVVAFIILIYPIRIVLIWAVLWAFMTAISRPISGSEWMEFVERSANWCLPLILLYAQGFPKKTSSLFKIRA